ncbi:MAG: Slp family lipoprotein [Deltaproteobacteria bacterium]|nr:MAG: Slp family lipoprotein [Deltaproteobacteria bacterium]
MRGILIVATTVLCFSGCAHVISKEVRQEVNTEIAFSELRETTQAYQGEVVLLGGVIVKTVNKKDGTLLEVYQTEIDRRGKPIQLDVSGGRFLAYYKGFLDSELYRKGRRVTIAGIVQGEQTLRLGELDYRYPYLVVRDIHLWRQEQLRKYDYYPWGLWDPWCWHPWYPWDPAYPWYDP